MKTYLDCIPCFIRQALEAARRVAPDDEALHRRVLDWICVQVPQLPETFSPPFVGELIHGFIQKETGIKDPYIEAKEHNLQRAQQLEPQLRAWLERHPDRFEAAVRVAIAGNIMDLGANPDFDLEAEMNLLEQASSDLSDLERLRQELESSEDVLYIGDNTGEAVFDKIFLEHLQPRRITFATRGRAIIDDITEDLARRIGLDRLAKVISSGSPIPGTDLSRVTDEFRTVFNQASVVIAKGQGNFESLSDAGRPIFFLFKVKCPVVAALAGQPVGASVVFRGGFGKPVE